MPRPDHDYVLLEYKGLQWPCQTLFNPRPFSSSQGGCDVLVGDESLIGKGVLSVKEMENLESLK